MIMFFQLPIFRLYRIFSNSKHIDVSILIDLKTTLSRHTVTAAAFIQRTEN